MGSELKKETDIAKDQYELWKDQKNNVIGNSREDDMEAEMVPKEKMTK